MPTQSVIYCQLKFIDRRRCDEKDFGPMGLNVRMVDDLAQVFLVVHDGDMLSVCLYWQRRIIGPEQNDLL